jgi:hypothetical protein
VDGPFVKVTSTPTQMLCYGTAMKSKTTLPRLPRLGPWLGIVLLLAPGCVRRRLTVRTNPPGALVSIDNQVIGTSPAATPFTYYGTREIRVEREGFRTETLRRRFNPPWYQIPPLDFITETLWPLEIRDERIVDVELVPRELPAVDAVLDRAGQLRSQSQQGVVPAPNISVTPPSITDPAPPPAPQTLPPGGVPLP